MSHYHRDKYLTDRVIRKILDKYLAGSDPSSIFQFNRSASRKSSFFSIWRVLMKHLRNAKKKIVYVPSVAEAMCLYMRFMKATLTYNIACLCDFCYSWISYC